jgi:IMP dehydrogenase/GMP reductase
MNLVLEESLGFESIAIKQKKNICKSRLDVDVSSEIIKGLIRPIPLIAANMSTVINPEFYVELHNLGAFGVLHRAKDVNERMQDVIAISQHCAEVATSIGVGNDEFEIACKLVQYGANILFVDIAHGYADTVIEIGRALKQKFSHIKVVLGNTTNIDMLEEVADFCDALKVGIAQGFACETKDTAGCTEKQFSAIIKFKERSRQLGIPIISCGGIKNGSDFTKVIAAGANSAMAGMIFAQCPESASPIIDGKKLYAGMASEWVQEQWKGGLKAGTCAEGGVRMLEVGEEVKTLLEYYSGSLRSGITYAGANDIKSFQDKVEFIRLI